jgi:hypothetical protein
LVDTRKRRLWQPAKRDACARIDDVVVFGGRRGGLEAVRLSSGEQVWVLEHPSRIAAVPLLLSRGHLFVVFDDRHWLRIDPRNGKRFASGELRRDTDTDRLTAEGVAPIGVFRCAAATPQGHHPGARGVELGDRAWSLEGWQPTTMLELCGDRLVVALRSTGSLAAAAAILDPVSLRMSHLIDLGPCGSPTLLDGASTVDGYVQIRLGDEVFLVDPRAGRQVVVLSERGATLFDATGRPVWRGRL